jgi:hydrogenase-4 component F
VAYCGAPWSGSLLVAGLFAVTGSPPFGLFASEITILGGAMRGGHPWVVAAMVVLLAIIFLGMAKMILGLIHGEPAAAAAPARERVSLLAGPIVLGLLVLLLGLHVPEPLQAVLGEAARALGGQAP